MSINRIATEPLLERSKESQIKPNKSVSSFQINPECRGTPKRIASLTQQISSLVQETGGNKTITSILVANNGLAAVKFIRSVRIWSFRTFGNDRAISIVAMATPEDIRINAEHVQMADQFIEVPGGTNNNNYANVRLILQTAERAGVDAVWPGWGHASENPELPIALSKTLSKIEFLGPSASAMAALGDKVGSTILAQAAGVPTIPWSGTRINISYSECQGAIPNEVYEKACVSTAQEVMEVCGEIGFPVMLKASWGGGGKGIRRINCIEEIETTFKQVQREVPGSPIFVMKLAPHSRHLEVQLLCDKYGNACSLLSRDCSLQRRHQKIVEEGPVMGVTPQLLDQMEKSARALARSVGYCGAATVEYLYSIKEGKYYFLELNPRLQVEHPVTEGITGVNIPACQVMIGMGIPLHRIPDLRSFFCEDPTGISLIDFENHKHKEPDGYVIAVRITSENANDGFKPTSGHIEDLHFRPTPEVWGYFSVKSGGGIHEFSDSQFGHLFAKGCDRLSALKSMVVALKDITIRGEIRTTVDYIINMIQDEAFVNQQIHTGWLDHRIVQQIKSESAPWHLSVIAGAVVKALETFNAHMADYLEMLEKGQTPPSSLSLTDLDEEFAIDQMKYKIHIQKQGRNLYQVGLNGSYVKCVARRQADAGILLQVDGQKHVIYYEKEPGGIRLSIDCWTCLLENEKDPSQILAPSPGKLVKYLVKDGCHVYPTQPYAEVEVMKMLMPLLAPASGTVRFRLQEGAVLNIGDLIAKLELDAPGEIKLAVVSNQKFLDTIGPPEIHSDRVDHIFATALEAAKDILAGYRRPVRETTESLLMSLDDQSLSHLRWTEQYSVVRPQIPGKLKESIEKLIEEYESWSEENLEDMQFPLESMLQVMEDALATANEDDRATLQVMINPLILIAKEHVGGKEGFAKKVTKELLEAYLEVEERFETSNTSTTEQEIISSLRQENADKLQVVLDMIISHQGIKQKSELVKEILLNLVLPSPEDYRPLLRRLVALKADGAQQVVLHAKSLLEQSLLADLRTMVARSLSSLNMFSGITSRHSDLSSTNSNFPDTLNTQISDISRGLTHQEGLYQGLSNMAILQATKSNIEAQKISMLAEAPAGVDDALALLLNQSNFEYKSKNSHNLLNRPVSDLGFDQRVLLAYVKRTYHPYLLQEPQIVLENEILLAVWSYQDPNLAIVDSDSGGICHGAMALLPSLASFIKAIKLSRAALIENNIFSKRNGTLHVAFPGHILENYSLAPELSKKETDDGESLVFFYDEEEEGNLGNLRKPEAEEASRKINESVFGAEDELRSANYTNVSVLLTNMKVPLRKGYWWNEEQKSFKQDIMLRHVEPCVARCLELSRLFSLHPVYSISRNRQWHIYTISEKAKGAGRPLQRVFLRGFVRQIGNTAAFLLASCKDNKEAMASSLIEEIEQTLINCLEELTRIQKTVNADHPLFVDWAHIFLYILPVVNLYQEANDNSILISKSLQCACAAVVSRRGEMLRIARVAQWVVRLHVSEKFEAWRVVVPVPTGYETGEECIDVYREILTGSLKTFMSYQSISDNGVSPGPLNGLPVLSPYKPLDLLQQKRLTARRHCTTYCYDFPKVFNNILRQIWSERAEIHEPQSTAPSGPLLLSQELGIVENQNNSSSNPFDWPLTHISNTIGKNKIGMIAWVMTMKTPECPLGRRIVAIANDITFEAGAFGPKEDAIFTAAVQYALDHKLPVVFLSANSGARVGMANEIKNKIKVEWIDDEDPSKGFKFLYLEESDYRDLKKQSEKHQWPSFFSKETQNSIGRTVHMLTDIIGLEDGLGVECLSGSSAMASIYSKAFKEIFTVTLVTGRTVGIGAYLARLGRRCVQCNQPIILTGYQALNKILGREVYTSQLQLGGPKIMGSNGVSHHIATSDLDGIKFIIKWLGYIPPTTNASLPILPSADVMERSIAYTGDSSEKQDPKRSISGYTDCNGEWIGGMFDRGSWMEVQEGWAKTVICGRARLGGIPIGVIAVERQTVIKNIPADPGMIESAEQNLLQAGQVWFPDSALKTAHAIEEFNLEGLPLMILANWRGFSGGQRDLFEGVLQAGSLIVDNLRTYNQPVFVYLPPGSELRGGAWVVVDSKINSDNIEMYADPSARGAILEPEGVVQIKFRKPDLISAMHRLDPFLASFNEISDTHTSAQAIREREKKLLPVYSQIALSFAEMHDTPVRMGFKGVIRASVPWRTARKFFALRLRRRMAEFEITRDIKNRDIFSSLTQNLSYIKYWFRESYTQIIDKCELEVDSQIVFFDSEESDKDFERFWKNDKFFIFWYQSSIGATKILQEISSIANTANTRVFEEMFKNSEGIECLLKELEKLSKNDAEFKKKLKSFLRNI